MVSVRWRPSLSAHYRKQRTSDKSMTQSFDVLRSSKWRLSYWTFFFLRQRLFICSFSPTTVQYCDWEHCRSDEYWSADEVSAESQLQNRCFRNTSPQRKPDAVQTSTPWQLKCFESRYKGAQGQVPHAKDSTRSCVAKSSGICAEPCTFREFIYTLQSLSKPMRHESAGLTLWGLTTHIVVVPHR
jgi:hypothetical protein